MKFPFVVVVLLINADVVNGNFAIHTFFKSNFFPQSAWNIWDKTDLHFLLTIFHNSSSLFFSPSVQEYPRSPDVPDVFLQENNKLFILAPSGLPVTTVLMKGR